MSSARRYIPCNMSDKVHEVLGVLRRRLEALYGERLLKVVLFGSQARGDARSDSDIDVAIVLRGDVDPNLEIDRVVPITAQLSLENDVLISCVYVFAVDYSAGQSPLLLNLRRDGVTV
jgi:predicted nucleotidyltransferase